MANDQRKRLANAFKGTQHTPEYGRATTAAARALALRQHAHAIDPAHTDPAWGLDTAPHAQIVAFLEQYIVAP